MIMNGTARLTMQRHAMSPSSDLARHGLGLLRGGGCRRFCKGFRITKEVQIQDDRCREIPEDVGVNHETVRHACRYEADRIGTEGQDCDHNGDAKTVSPRQPPTQAKANEEDDGEDDQSNVDGSNGSDGMRFWQD